MHILLCSSMTMKGTWSTLMLDFIIYSLWLFTRRRTEGSIKFKLPEFNLILSNTIINSPFLSLASRLWDEPFLHAEGGGVQPGPPGQWHPVFTTVHSWRHHICPGRQWAPLLPHKPKTHPLWGGSPCRHQPDDLLRLRSRPTAYAVNQVLSEHSRSDCRMGVLIGVILTF